MVEVEIGGSRGLQESHRGIGRWIEGAIVVVRDGRYVVEPGWHTHLDVRLYSPICVSTVSIMTNQYNVIPNEVKILLREGTYADSYDAPAWLMATAILSTHGDGDIYAPGPSGTPICSLAATLFQTDIQKETNVGKRSRMVGKAVEPLT